MECARGGQRIGREERIGVGPEGREQALFWIVRREDADPREVHDVRADSNRRRRRRADPRERRKKRRTKF
jgi:hypothetical protein